MCVRNGGGGGYFYIDVLCMWNHCKHTTWCSWPFGVGSNWSIFIVQGSYINQQHSVC